MLLAALALLAAANFARAASPAQATYCSEDNLLRAFQHTSASAAAYCSATKGYPAFLAVTSYPATRLSSACSCFSRFPTEGSPATPTTSTTSTTSSTSTTTTAASCTPGTLVAYNGNGQTDGIPLHLLYTLDLTQSCNGIRGASAGMFKVIKLCGTYNNFPVTFDTSVTLGGADYYSFPAGGVDGNGIDFEYNSGAQANFFIESDNNNQLSLFTQSATVTTDEVYPESFSAVACGSLQAVCPTPV